MHEPPADQILYLPHDPDDTPNKSGKFRRVANAAFRFCGQSFNVNLFTAPDLLNSLLGDLMRLSENPVAVLADIKGIFMQIAMNRLDQSKIRFLWINDKKAQQYQFTRLIFCATCSPSCAIYVLINCIEKSPNKYPDAIRAVKNHFDKDNYIQLFKTISNAPIVVQQTLKSLQGGGFCLEKFVSKKTKVLERLTIENTEQSNEIVKVLGQKWNPSSDAFIIKSLTNFSLDAS